MNIRGKAFSSSAALTALLLASCQGEQPAPSAAARLPAQVCDQARDALDKLSATGSFEYAADGQATLEEAAWLPMGGEQRDAIAQALAFHAACSAPEPPREQSITIKNEGGRVLSQRVMETSVDVTKILEQ
jgi:hypothetical protein